MATHIEEVSNFRAKLSEIGKQGEIQRRCDPSCHVPEAESAAVLGRGHGQGEHGRRKQQPPVRLPSQPR